MQLTLKLRKAKHVLESIVKEKYQNTRENGNC